VANGRKRKQTIYAMYEGDRQISGNKILLIMPPSFIEPYLGKGQEMPLSWTVIFGLIVMGLLMLRMNPW
jgi:hypothetical protein